MRSAARNDSAMRLVSPVNYCFAASASGTGRVSRPLQRFVMMRIYKKLSDKFKNLTETNKIFDLQFFPIPF